MADRLVLMVNVRPGCRNSGLLRVAGNLAESLDAQVIGIGAWQPMPVDWTAGNYSSSNFPGLESTTAQVAIHDAEIEFRKTFPAPGQEWRSSLSFAPPSIFIVEQVRHADLVLTGLPPINGSDDVRAVAGEVVEKCGRPVIIVPDAPKTFSADRVMVAWKDTSETRRAILGALPLLRRATKITVVEIVSAQVLLEAGQGLIGISRWLANHSVTVETVSVAALHDDAEQLESLAHDLGVNLIVAGAFGHNRLREWAFGGITRVLLQRGSCCTLLSH